MASTILDVKRICYACGSDKTALIRSRGFTYPSWINADGHIYCRRCYYREIHSPKYRDKRRQTYQAIGRDKARDYYLKHRESILIIKRRFWTKNRKALIAKKNTYRQNNVQKISALRKEHYTRNREIILSRDKPRALALRRKQRLAVLQHYSNNLLICACCHESIYEFLTIDHINNDGNMQVKIYGKGRALSLADQRGFS